MTHLTPENTSPPSIYDDDGNRGGGQKRRKTLAIGITIACVLVVGGGIGFFALSSAAQKEAVAPKAPAATAAIQKGTLSGSSTKTGTLAFTDPRPLGSAIGGTLTALPAPGAQIGLGVPLYAVDNNPISLLHGSLPAWRGFEQGMEDGPDVKQLEESLAALGYFAGAPDTKFNWSTAQAIKRWQKATGQKETGALELGRIIFAPGDLRVGGAKVAVGDQVGPGSPVLEVTGLEKQVTLNLGLSDQRLAVMGGPVGLELPGGVKTTGKIVAVGAPEEKENNGKKETVVPVTIALDDPSVTGDIQQASVSINLPSETRENVLSVPVEALIALDGNTFGVEIMQPDGTTRRVPVTTGLFAAGNVEVSGDGISEGQKVVVPEL